MINMKIEKDEMYVLLQPKHVLMSIVIVNDEFPLNLTAHKSIDKLNEVSDVVFIFSDKHNPKSKRVDKNKFASLYNACAWLDSGESLPESLFHVFEYSKEIFEKHVGYNILHLKDLSETGIPEKMLDNINSLLRSSSVKPVFKCWRLNNIELSNIYINPELETKKSRIFNFINCKKDDQIVNNVDLFTTYTSNSVSMFLKSTTVNVLLDFVKLAKSNNYTKPGELFDITTFNERSDVKFLLSSFIKYLGLGIINSSVEDLDIGDLS